MVPKIPLLHPIVIPPVSSPPFTCQGEGLVCEGWMRESLESLKMMVASSKRPTKEARVHPRTWWRAQLQLYGLNPGFSSTRVAVLQNRFRQEIKKGLKGPSKEVRDLEKKLNVQFIKKNAIARSRLKFNSHESRGYHDHYMIEKEEKLDSDVCGEENAIAEIRNVEVEVEPVSVPLNEECKLEDVTGEWRLKSSDPEDCVYWSDARMYIFFETVEEGSGDSSDTEWNPETLEEGSGDSNNTEWNPERKPSIIDGNFTESSHRDILRARLDLWATTGTLHVKHNFPKSGPIPAIPIPVVWHECAAKVGRTEVSSDGSSTEGLLQFFSRDCLIGELNSSFGILTFEGMRMPINPYVDDATSYTST